MNSFSTVLSLLEVATNKGCGKAPSDSGLRCSIETSRLPEATLNKITLRNLIRSAGASSPFWPIYTNDQLTLWMGICVQVFNQENTSTALQTGVYRAQRSKFNRLKIRINLKTTGLNPFGSHYLGEKRSTHSTYCVSKEGVQVNFLPSSNRRLFSTKILTTDLKVSVLTTNMIKAVKSSKNKDERYGNLLQMISSVDTLILAYLIIKGKKKISAKGIGSETLDGISIEYFHRISSELKSGSFNFSPVRRVNIPKPGTTVTRLLDLSKPRQKIVQKAMELVLSIIFESKFLDCSHGSRPGRDCDSALKRLQMVHVYTYSFCIKGNIKGCFDNIPHAEIIKGINREVDCPFTLNLVRKSLNAGFVLDEELKKQGKNARIYKSNLGILQGIALNQLFSNIVLHELDLYVCEVLDKEFCKGKDRQVNLEYRRLRYKIKAEDDLKTKKKLISKSLRVTSKVVTDPDFKRIFYTRYVDDWVLFVSGSIKDAKTIRSKVSKRLLSLGLTLNLEKTHITSLKKSICHYLGVNFLIRKNNKEHFKPARIMKKNKTSIRQRFVPKLIFKAPIRKLLRKLQDQGFVKRSSWGEFFPKGKPGLTQLTHHQIINYFNSRIRGVLDYYCCVHNRNELWAIFRFLKYSCALTLARKFKLKTLAKTFKKFGPGLTFVNKVGKVYTIYNPENFRMLPFNKRFKAGQSLKLDELLT
jgi:RNA-directed DNA polymerase